MWHGKDDMIVLDGQGRLDEFFDPSCLFNTKAFGAVPVATTVVAVADFTTMITCVFMSAQRSSTAL